MFFLAFLRVSRGPEAPAEDQEERADRRRVADHRRPREVDEALPRGSSVEIRSHDQSRPKIGQQREEGLAGDRQDQEERTEERKEATGD